jgi:integrase
MSVKLREKKLKSGKRSLYLDIYQDGRRRYEFLKKLPKLDGTIKDKKTLSREDKETVRLAEIIRSDREKELMYKGYGFKTPNKGKVNFIEFFKKDMQRFDESTKKGYNNVLKKLLSYKGEKITFVDIDSGWIEGFKKHLLNELSNNTAKIYFAMFKASLNRATKKPYEIISENPANKVENIKKENGKKIKYLTMEELRTLAGAECPHDEVKQAFLFSCSTGLRYSDIEALTWNDVNDNRVEFVQKKVGVPEYVDLNQAAKSILDGRDQRYPYVFQLPTNAHANQVLKDWAANAELKKWIRIEEGGEIIQSGLSFHAARHTFAVQVLAAGADIYTLKELLGHSSIASTEVYAKVVSQTKKQAVNQLPKF